VLLSSALHFLVSTVSGH